MIDNPTLYRSNERSIREKFTIVLDAIQQLIKTEKRYIAEAQHLQQGMWDIRE